MDELKQSLLITILCCVPIIIMVVWIVTMHPRATTQIVEVEQDQTEQVPIEQVPDQIAEEPIAEQREYGIGDTWTVDGQWSITVNSVYESDERNEYSEQNPEAVYIISYSYENLGYEDDTGYWDGYYFDFANETIVDADGEMGYSYPDHTDNVPQETPVGAYCNAETFVGVNHAGDFTINVSERDSNEKKQTAVFHFHVGG